MPVPCLGRCAFTTPATLFPGRCSASPNGLCRLYRVSLSSRRESLSADFTQFQSVPLRLMRPRLVGTHPPGIALPLDVDPITALSRSPRHDFSHSQSHHRPENPLAMSQAGMYPAATNWVEIEADRFKTMCEIWWDIGQVGEGTSAGRTEILAARDRTSVPSAPQGCTGTGYLLNSRSRNIWHLLYRRADPNEIKSLRNFVRAVMTLFASSALYTLFTGGTLSTKMKACQLKQRQKSDEGKAFMKECLSRSQWDRHAQQDKMKAVTVSLRKETQGNDRKKFISTSSRPYFYTITKRDWLL